MRRVTVTYHRGVGGKMVHILKSLTPVYLFTLTLSGRYEPTTKIKHVIDENSVYPIVKATSFYAHAQYHVSCA